MFKQHVESAASALEAVDALRARALVVVADAPYWKYVSEPEWARVSLHGETAVLHLCKAEVDWDSPSFETEEIKFPSVLLFISDGDLAVWKEEHQRAYDQQQAQRTATARAAKEAEERAAYEALKRKFGG